MSGIVPQGINSAQFDVILQLAAAWLLFGLISNSIDFVSKIVHKVCICTYTVNLNIDFMNFEQFVTTHAVILIIIQMLICVEIVTFD